MIPPTSSAAAGERVARSLVSWWETPPRSSLERGDTVRFAHGIATLARQLMAAVSGINADCASWMGDRLAAPRDFTERLKAMIGLVAPEQTARTAEELLDETLDLLSRHGIKEADRRFAALHEQAPRFTMEEAESLAQAIFERARRLGARAVLIADSYARGFADAFSDVDIRLLVTAVPTLAERRALVLPFADSALVRQYGDEAYITSDQFLRHGRKIDVKYHPVSWLERALTEPFALGGPIDLLEVMEVNVPVADPDGVFARLSALGAHHDLRVREIASVSIGALRTMMDREIRSLAPFEAAAMMLGPGLEYLVRAWAGLNGHVHAFPKWMHRYVGELDVQPLRAWPRLVALASGPWTDRTFSRREAEWRSFLDDLTRCKETFSPV